MEPIPIMSKQEPPLGLRLIVHALMAIFMANAANKFFVVDLDYELTHGFYARIFQGLGDAPDQYRILPLLPLKLLCGWLPFNHAVLVYNMILGWVVLELQWRLARSLNNRWRWAAGFGLCVFYIYLQYTGWRPDTLGLLALCMAAAMVLKDMRDASLRMVLYGLCIVLLSLSRADIALIYALFATFYRKRIYAVYIPIPIVCQILLQSVIYPDAVYYSKTVMLLDNLRLHYLMHHPLTYLLPAVVLAFWGQIKSFVAATFQKNYYFYLLMVGYLVLVLVIGRINEYRLYLPFVPLLLVIAHGRKSRE